MTGPEQGYEPMEAPPAFEVAPPPPPDRPTYLGTIVLSLLLLLLIVGSLASYFDRDPAGKRSYTQTHAALRQAVRLSELPSRLAGKSKSDKEAVPKVDQYKALDPRMQELEQWSKGDPEAAAILAVMRYERKMPVDEALLEPLQKSKEEDLKLIAEVYAPKPPTRERAVEIAKKLDEKEFAFQWAGVHALERAGDTSAREKAMPTSDLYRSSIVLVLGALAFGLGIVTLVGYTYMRLSGNWKPQGHPLSSISAVQADGLMLRATQMFVALYGTQVLAGVALKPILGRYEALAVSVILGIAAVVAVAAIPLKGEKRSVLSACIGKDGFGKNILWGVFGAFANLPILLIVTLISTAIFAGLPPPEHPITVELQSSRSIFAVAAMMLAATVGAPIMEELIFRASMLAGALRLIGRPVLATILVNLAFAAIHPTGIPAWAPLAMVGITASILTNMRGSLVPAIVMHATHNMMLLVLTLTVF